LIFLEAAASSAPAFDPSPAEKDAAALVSEDAIRAHIRFLADDLLEGRAPGSRGDGLTQLYLSSEFQALGLKPGAPGGGWLQRFPLIGMDTQVPETIAFRKGSEDLRLRFREDFVALCPTGRPTGGVRDAEVVFVGYGMVAPEYRWDDFKDTDLRGKVLLIMNNDPSSSPDLFGGETRLYYGRWDYKYEMAARKGAAGAIIIHTTPSAGYPWTVVQTSFTGEQFDLKDRSGPVLEMAAWITEDKARSLARLGGADLDALRQAAERRDFRPAPLGVRLSLDLPSKVREVESANVLGLLPGSDPQRSRETLIITAHHDHLGVAAEGSGGADRIYNGAVDNASGAAVLLALARAHARLGPPPRSILFATVAAEEQGLLGSAYLAAHPPVPAGLLAATINIDGINIWGRTRDVTMVGLGKSSLDEIVRAVAAWQGREVKPDQFPDRGFFYRSDQFSLAKIGVPGIYLDSGTDFPGRPPGWGKAQIEEWEKVHYHQPSDEYRADWDLSGAVDDARLLFYASLLIARSPDLPAWRAGDEFEAARKAALGTRH